MLHTLHLYILRELGKVFGIAALGLTLILSLGGLLQPLRHQGLSAVQLFQLIVYLFPVMLTFSLPVASLLAATLVYGRLSADNELTACRASGISMYSLFVPAVALGAAVLTANLFLSNWFIPQCAKRAADVVKEDIQDIAFNKLNSDKQLIYGRWVIRAEQVVRSPDNPNRMLLIAPAMAEIRQKKPEQLVMCQRAVLEFDPPASTVTIYPEQAVAMDWATIEEPARVLRQPLRWRIPPLVKDDVGFKSYGELRQLQENPDPYYRVQRELDRCRRLAMQRVLYDEMTRVLGSRRPDGRPGAFVMRYENFTEAPPAHREAIIEASQVERGRGELILGAADGVDLPADRGDDAEPGARVTLFGPADRSGGRGQPLVVYQSRQAKLSTFVREDEIGPMVDITFPRVFQRRNLLVNAPAAEKTSGVMTERLLPPAGLVERVNSMSRQELADLARMHNQVQAQVSKLQREIVAEMHSRAAFSVAGLVLVVLGAALGILFRSGHVLVAFGVAAVPAMFAITMVVMGNKIATSSTSTAQGLGIPLTWSGNLLTIALVGMLGHFRLFKN